MEKRDYLSPPQTLITNWLHWGRSRAEFRGHTLLPQPQNVDGAPPKESPSCAGHSSGGGATTTNTTTIADVPRWCWHLINNLQMLPDDYGHLLCISMRNGA